MNWNPLPWLLRRAIRGEAAQWSADGLIQPDQQRRIEDRYADGCCGLSVSSCGRMTLAALAALSMISAVLLVVADRWEFIHPWLKVCVALLLMSLAHGSGYWYRFRMQETGRGDACFLVGSMLFGVAMLLAADRAGGSAAMYSWACFGWAGATLPLAWVLNSAAMLAVADVAGVAWFVTQMSMRDASYTSLFVALGLCLIRWSYVHRRRGVLVLALLSLVLWWVMLAVAEELGSERYFWIASLGPVLYLIGLRHSETDSFGADFRGVGLCMTGVLVLALAMPSSASDVLAAGNLLRYWMCGVAAAGAIAAFVPASRRLDLRREWVPLAVLAAITLLPAALGAVAGRVEIGGSDVAVVLLAGVMNLLAVLVAVSLVLFGIKHGRSESIAGACIYFSVWGILLCYDLAAHRVAAALIFALAGASLMATTRWGTQLRTRSHEAIPVEDV